MEKYAIVRIINDKTPALAKFIPRYIKDASTRKDISTISHEIYAVSLLKKFLGKVDIGDVTAERADSYKLHLLSKFSTNTARVRFGIAKALFQYATSIGIISSNPFSNIKLPPPHFAGRVLSDAELKKFLNAMPERFRRACTIAVYTGMRRKEILGMDWGDIDENYITVPAHRAKSRKERRIVLHSAVKRVLGIRGRGQERLFTYGHNMLNKCVTATWRKLNIGRIRFHDLRHTWATRYMETPGADIYAMAQQAGWVNVSSGIPYQHITPIRQNKGLEIYYAI